MLDPLSGMSSFFTRYFEKVPSPYFDLKTAAIALTLSP
jgi:hypothetical protein